MLFEFYYNKEEYLIQLKPFYGEKDKAEVFRIKYSDHPNDSDDYEIKLFKIENQEVVLLHVLDFPKKFLDIIGEHLRNAMPKSFYVNPYFDEVIVFFGNSVLTSKDRFIPHSCTLSDRKELYEKKGKENKGDYIKDIQAKLLNNPNPKWPFKGRLHVQFSVSDTKKRLDQIDLDNLAKAILDSLQGMVFENDAQIVALVATKDYTEGMVGTLIAIKELYHDERQKLQEYFYSEKMKTYQAELRAKRKQGKSTRFVWY